MGMTAEDWSLVKSAFQSALDIPESARRDYVDAAYGDRPEIARYVLDLLEDYREESVGPKPKNESNHNNVFQPGQVVAGRFRIVRLLGTGGMGQVFLAQDERLSVSIALKTLHGAFAGEPEFVERFRREIRVARQVSHPNLCRVFDLVEHRENGQLTNCLTMELLEGESLAACITRERPMEPTQALRLLRPIGEALSALHESGIIHRDLKPSNIILIRRPDNELRVVVTDFGLAKPIADGSVFFESYSGARVGSPYFMAPELWNGVRPSTASDLYALGLILDEMVTRAPAFDTSSVPSFYHSKFLAGPIPPGQRSTRVPPSWQDAILKCLAIDMAARYRTCAELISDLEKISLHASMRTAPPFMPVLSRTGEPSSPAVQTIAVLPFSDLSPDRSQAYLCDGFAEELIHLLSQIPSLRVIARTSVFEVRDANISAMEIGLRLNATHLIHGSVRKSREKLRVGVQLVDIAQKCNVWSRQFDRQMNDIFAIQEEIARASVELLKGILDADSRLAQARPPTSNMESYHAYLQGLFEFNQQTPVALQSAIRCFERATTIDADFALAYGGLADSYCTQEWYGTRPANEVMPKAREFAVHALQLDPSLANVHCTLGRVLARFDWNWEGAAQEFKDALSLGPGIAKPYFAYALDYLTPLGKLEEALRYIGIALELDPLSPILHSALGGCLHRMRSYDVSERNLRHALTLMPDFYHLHWSLARTLEQVGRFDEAAQRYALAIQANPDNWLIRAELGHCYGRMGKRDQAQAILDDLLAAAEHSYVSPLCRAFAYLGLSDIKNCLEAIEAAAEERAGALIWLSLDPRLDPVKSEPLLHRIQVSMRISSNFTSTI
jgi:serine/threonine protein kinase/tetratricopeptide (TPR) repeat protein